MPLLAAGLVLGGLFLFAWEAYREGTAQEQAARTRTLSLVETALLHKGKVLVLTRPEQGQETIGRIVSITPEGVLTLDIRRPKWDPETREHAFPAEPPAANDLRSEEIDDAAFYSFTE